MTERVGKDSARLLSKSLFEKLALSLAPHWKSIGSVWDSPKVKAIVDRPAGTPLDLSGLSEEEISELASQAKGMWADHPQITNSVEWVSDLRKGLSKSFSERE